MTFLNRGIGLFTNCHIGRTATLIKCCVDFWIVKPRKVQRQRAGRVLSGPPHVVDGGIGATELARQIRLIVAGRQVEDELALFGRCGGHAHTTRFPLLLYQRSGIHVRWDWSRREIKGDRTLFRFHFLY